MGEFYLQSLSLRAEPGKWQHFAARKVDEAFRVFAEKVFKRDQYTCQFCGFQAKDYQEVINLDNNYQNNKLSNMVTSCCFCAQCQFVESVGAGDYGGGTLIFLPEMSQAELNSFCHVVFCAITNDTGYKTSAQSAYRSLKFRSQALEQKFGDGSSNPAIFGQLLIDAGVVQDDAKVVQIFQDIRLLPSRAKFKKQIESWALEALDELSKES
ncbi:MAG: HNH endonuclease [Legionellales bacterium]|nr:HNH endonuclease [Legionellales bacterium]